MLYILYFVVHNLKIPLFGLVAAYTYWTVLCWCLLYAGRVCNFGDSGSILSCVMGCPDWLLYGTPQPFQENIRVVPRLRHNRFLPNSCQFIIYRISYLSKSPLLIYWKKLWNKVLETTVTTHKHTHTYIHRLKWQREREY